MTERSASQKQKYLAAVLQFNPVHDAGKILRLRGRLLGTNVEGEQASEAKLNVFLRTQAQAQINEVRTKVWTEHPQSLETMIDSIDISQSPELRATVERLRFVANYRSEFVRLSQHPRTHVNLNNTLRRVVMLPPKEAGALKESYLRQIIESPTLKPIQRMVDMMKREFPELYQIESDWLGDISGLAGRRAASAQSSGSSTESFGSDVPGCAIWILVVVAIRVVIFIVRNASQ